MRFLLYLDRMFPELCHHPNGKPFYVLKNGRNQYIRKRWCGGIQLTKFFAEATEWQSYDEAKKWARDNEFN